MAEIERQLLHNDNLLAQVEQKFFEQKRKILELERQRATRKTSVATLIKRAEKSGHHVTSVTMADGAVLHFGEPAPAEASNPWFDDLRATKQ